MAARYCPQCSQDVSPTARFCANCAAPLISPGAASQPTVAASQPAVMRTGSYPSTFATLPPDVAPPRSRPWIPILATLAVILLIAVGALGARLHHDSVLEAQSHPLPAMAPLLSAPSTPLASAPPLLSAPSHPLPPSAPLTNAPSTPGPQLPNDVAAYLKFLQGIEERRVALTNDLSLASGTMATAQQMQGQMGDVDPDNEDQHAKSVTGNLDKIAQGYGKISAKWQQLFTDFRSFPPPASCNDLAGYYWILLNDQATLYAKIDVIMKNVQTGSTADYNAVAQAQNLDEEEKAVNPAAFSADNSLGQVCSKYSVPKPFSIQADGASSSMLGP